MVKARPDAALAAAVPVVAAEPQRAAGRAVDGASTAGLSSGSLRGVGLSNSPLPASTGHPLLTEAGVDTWSPAWYVDPHSDAFAAFRDRFCTVLGPRGSRLLPAPVIGYRVGLFPSGLLFAEGHPAGPGRLCPAGELPLRGLELQDALLRIGAPIAVGELPFGWTSSESQGFAGFRRVDATANCDVGSRMEVAAVLAGLAAVVRDSPSQLRAQWNADQLGTVYMLGYAGRRVLARWYDKSAEMLARGEDPGSDGVVRGEDQRRWSKAERPGMDDLTPEAVRHRFHRRFVPLYRAAKGVKVCGPIVAGQRIADLVEAGELAPQQGRLLAGDILVAAGGRGIARGRTLRRSAAIRRRLGIVVSSGDLEEIEVDVSAVLEACLDGPAWGCG